mmetsp:Transcript_87004/g.281751  ORF Transcript_87004/g.281751 Transcript_87004/m.281751 type:complete len:246 (+) Transcript_87004:48-785(+)
MGALVATLAFPVPPKEWGSQHLRARNDLMFLNTARQDKIAAVHIKRGAERTILYSHGNAEDLGQILPYLDKMSEACLADVLAYDYSGYGISEGTPSEENCYMCIDAAYGYLRQHVSPSRIIAFGRSIGSGPTVDLVSRHPEISGMVLQSPLESGGRAVLGYTASVMLYSMDIFRNYEKIVKVECPVLIIHGTADKVVPCANGRAIHAACKQAAEPLWITGRGHNDMPERVCLARMREFCDSLARH